MRYPQYTKQINRGIAVLNKNNPGWHHQLDLTRLDISSDTRCVLGQLYGYYTQGLSDLGIHSLTHYGFNTKRRYFIYSFFFWVFSGFKPGAGFKHYQRYSQPLAAEWRDVVAQMRIDNPKPPVKQKPLVATQWIRDEWPEYYYV